MKSCLNLNHYYTYTFDFEKLFCGVYFLSFWKNCHFSQYSFTFFQRFLYQNFFLQLSTVYIFFPILEFTEQPNQHIVRRRRHLNANVVTSHAFVIYFFLFFFSVMNSEYCLVGDIMPSPSVAHWLSRILSVKNFQKVQY